jgi:hypothetical protein
MGDLNMNALMLPVHLHDKTSVLVIYLFYPSSIKKLETNFTNMSHL